MKTKLHICCLAATIAFLASSALAKNAENGAFEGAFSELADNDQTEFVATVNRSLAKSAKDKPMDDRRIKTVTRVNRDAVRGTPVADRKKVLAEVFTTAPFECLPSIVDCFSAELFNRRAYASDEAFTEFAAAALMTINMRLRRPDDDRPNTRATFAVIMFLKAAGDKLGKDLREPFMIYVPTGSHVICRKEWFPAVFGEIEGQAPTYQPLLEAKERGEEPPHDILLKQISDLETHNKVVGSDLRVSHAWDISSPRLGSDPHGMGDEGIGGDTGLSRVPRGDVENPDSPWYRRRRGDNPDPTPTPYAGQTF